MIHSMISSPRPLKWWGGACAYCSDVGTTTVHVYGSRVNRCCDAHVVWAETDRRAWLYEANYVKMGDLVWPVSTVTVQKTVAPLDPELFASKQTGTWRLAVLLENGMRVRVPLTNLKRSGLSGQMIERLRASLDTVYKAAHDDYLVRAYTPIVRTVYKDGREITEVSAPALAFKTKQEIIMDRRIGRLLDSIMEVDETEA